MPRQLLFLFFSMLQMCSILASPITIYYDVNVPEIEFGVHEIKSALEAQQQQVEVADLSYADGIKKNQIILVDAAEITSRSLMKKNNIQAAELQPEGYSIRIENEGKHS